MNGITVNEAVELLKGHGAILKAGRNGLTNIINTVSVLEVPSYQHWLEGGELFLTTLNAFSADSEVVNLVKNLSAAGAAALALHPGNNIKVAMSDEGFALADRLNLPILVLPRTIPYSTVFSIIMGAVLNKQKVLLEKSQEINKYLTDILLSGGSFERVAQSLNELLNKPVLITDGTLEVTAVLGTSDFPAEIFLSKARKALSELHESTSLLWSEANGKRLGVNTFIVPLEDEEADLLVARAVFGQDIFGYVATLNLDGTGNLFDSSAMILSHTATAVALEETKRRAVQEAEESLNMEFIDDLLNGRFESSDTIVQRAKHRGLNLGGKYVVIIVSIDQYEELYMEHMAHDPERIQEIKNRIYKSIENTCRKHGHKNMVLPKGDRVIILPQIIAVPKEEEFKPELISLAETIKSQTDRMFEKITVSIGLGSLCESYIDLARSFRHAEQALKIGLRLKGTSGVFDFEQLGIYSLLLSFGNDQLKSGCEDSLNRIMTYDSKNNAELLKTMEAYLDCSENVSKTAEMLFIHPNTVKYRLERIRNILGKDPFKNGEEKLYYHLALKAVKIL